MFATLIFAVAVWTKIGKEKMPDFSANSINIDIPYPGASAEDVELFIIKPIEEELKTLKGFDQVISNASYANANFYITFESYIKDDEFPDKIQEIKDAISSVELPQESRLPVYRQWSSKEMAIVDLALFNNDSEVLSTKQRIDLQKMALAIKDQLLSLENISSVEATGYLRPEYQIKVDSKKADSLEISMNLIRNQILQQHVRTPIGSMEDEGESKITLLSELTSIEALENVLIINSFGGKQIRLKDIATVSRGFEKRNNMIKVNGHEAVVFKIKKSEVADIITSVEEVKGFVSQLEFKDNYQLIFMDDESVEVKARLSLVANNGLVGFLLIVIVLFAFLNFKSGFWVAMGIPFSMGITLISCYLLGLTVNNVTLAGIIIVLGIVVDDAIIVCENILQKRSEGMNAQTAIREGTSEVITPVLASTLTTCIAFVPLIFFSGRFGDFISSIPLIVCLMLFASLFESAFILPGHITPQKEASEKGKVASKRKAIIEKWQYFYEKFLFEILRFRSIIIFTFVLLLASSVFLFRTKLKFVMFPREETKDVSILVEGSDQLNYLEMAKKLKGVEEYLLNSFPGMVSSVYSRVAESRRGGEVKENKAFLKVEFVPEEDRKMNVNKVIKNWEISHPKFDDITTFRVLRNRFGSESGSAIIIEVQENDDPTREHVAQLVKDKLSEFPDLSSVEIEKPVVRREYKFHLDAFETSRLGFDFSELARTLRTYIEGDILYYLIQGDEEIDVRLTSNENFKVNIQEVLNLKVSNQESYFVPIKNLVEVKPGVAPGNISRTDFKRATTIYADLKNDANLTPLEVADKLNYELLQKIRKEFPSTRINFRGEVEESRDSQKDFGLAFLIVVLSIYILLIFLFDSFWTPALIGLIIPFGIIGAILSLWLHGITEYGFFGLIGIIGMIGIVINDSIVLLAKLQEDFKEQKIQSKTEMIQLIAKSSKTRLRAVILTTVTTVVGLFPTAYGIGGDDPMIAEMMFVMCWGLLFGTFITLVLVPCTYSIAQQVRLKLW